MKQPPRSSRGFALISALAVLTILVILVVAFATTMRTERSASQNFLERERAQAIGQAMLNRIMADHAAPVLKQGGAVKALAPFTVNATTKLPDAATQTAYIDNPAMGVYVIEPMKEVSSTNRLVRISYPSLEGTQEVRDAYTPEDWAWARQRDARELLPLGQDGAPIAPKWVDYEEKREVGKVDNLIDIPIGEVAFTVWDESGSIDINLAGKDENLNGMAPHDLGFEQLALEPSKFVQLLDRSNGRQRSNFSLRAINKDVTKDDLGDDKWFFSSEEMMVQNLFSPDNIQKVTTMSRDFDVRPEWDGDRDYAEAEKYLKSFINNEKLFRLFTNPKAGARLVRGTFAENQLEAVLKSVIPAADIGKDKEDWMQIMRLLAAIRQALPITTGSSPSTAWPGTTPLPMNEWTDADVYGIALNIMQAAAPASDQNLFAYDRNAFGFGPFNDPNVRMGVRVSPYITEVAMKAERQNATQVKMTAYMELWNPYSHPLTKPNGQAIKWFIGNWTGGTWAAGEGQVGGLYSMSSRWELPGVIEGKNYTPPDPGKFKTVQIGPSRLLDWPLANGDLVIRTRPYIQNQDYWNTLVNGSANAEESSSYSVSIGPFFTQGGSNPEYNLVHCFPKALLAEKSATDQTKYAPVWHSFQIDDPRMGPFTRHVKYANGFRTNETQMKYSWKAYENAHSLFEVIDDTASKVAEKKLHAEYGDGFNQNFGENWPPSMNFNGAMATFALPMRPFLNVGEIGSVFANRPWRTLSFASTTVPTDPTVKPPVIKTLQNVPTALLDYLTTIGTTSDVTKLNYKAPGSSPTNNFNVASINARKQDKRWLFEKVDKEGRAAGPLRPIRGRVNLNSASRETIKRLLSAPYRLPRSIGLTTLFPAAPSTGAGNDIIVTIAAADADLVAKEFEGDSDSRAASIRPLRAMADLSRLKSIKTLHEKYPDPVVDAIVARLAQFGTVRQQIYTVDMVARALNTKQEQKRLTNADLPRVVTAEVRFQARVYFDTFSRKGFIESIEYR